MALMLRKMKNPASYEKWKALMRTSDRTCRVTSHCAPFVTSARAKLIGKLKAKVRGLPDHAEWHKRSTTPVDTKVSMCARASSIPRVFNYCYSSHCTAGFILEGESYTCFLISMATGGKKRRQNDPAIIQWFLGKFIIYLKWIELNQLHYYLRIIIWKCLLAWCLRINLP